MSSSRSTMRNLQVTAQAAVIGLAVLNLGLVLDIIFRLLQSGEEAIGLLLSLVTTTTALIGVRLAGIRNTISGMLGERGAWLFPVLAQVALLTLILAGRQPLLNTLAFERVTEALVTEDIPKARSLLHQADTLGWDIRGTLADELRASLTSRLLSETESRSIRLAGLFTLFVSADSETRTNFVTWLIPETCNRAAQGNIVMPVFAQVMALVTPDQAIDFANDLNDAALLLATGSQPTRVTPRLCEVVYEATDRFVIRTYLETIRTLDNLLLYSDRSFAQRSIARANLATYILAFDPAPEALDTAQRLYLEALQLDSQNHAARYLMTSNWLIYVDRFAEPLFALDNAVRVGEQGIESLQRQGYCSGVQDLTDPVTADNSWYCFLLLTTVSGARWQRLKDGVPAGDDSLNYVETTLRQAVRFAEVNGHFNRIGTGEAHYYLAQLLLEQSPPAADLDAVLCGVLINSDSQLPRHISWQSFAAQHLGGTRCR